MPRLFDRIVVGGVLLGQETAIGTITQARAAGAARVGTLGGAVVLQTVGPGGLYPSNRSGGTIDLELRFSRRTESQYLAALRILERARVQEVFLGDLITDTWHVLADSGTLWRTSRRLPLGLPGVAVADWVTAWMDGEPADIITTGTPGDGEVLIPTAAAIGAVPLYTTIETADLVAANVATLQLQYAPLRSCTIAYETGSEQYGEYVISATLTEAVA